MFAERRVHKTYIALVHGTVKLDRGTLNASISRDQQRRTRMTTRRLGGRTAVSHYRVQERFESRYGHFTLLEVRDRNRTHASNPCTSIFHWASRRRGHSLRSAASDSAPAGSSSHASSEGSGPGAGTDSRPQFSACDAVELDPSRVRQKFGIRSPAAARFRGVG